MNWGMAEEHRLALQDCICLVLRSVGGHIQMRLIREIISGRLETVLT